MRVLITGATGLIGQEIVKLCHQSDIDVNYLTTRKNKIQKTSNYTGYFWDPYTAEIDDACFENVDVIIHLAGATVAKRWTSSYKKLIIESRTKTTGLLYNTLKNRKHTIKQIVSASAIGIYQDSFQNYYMEDANEIDHGFLGQVVISWEQSVNEFKNLNIGVSFLRVGLVLSNKGGAFPKIVNPIKLGFGAFFGNGKQWQSWIHIRDLAKMFLFIAQKHHTGVFNAVAPNPVSNKKMTQAIASHINKRIILPNVPRLTMKLILGEMHTLLFSSKRVCSSKIADTGFEFEYDNIQQAVEDLLEA